MGPSGGPGAGPGWGPGGGLDAIPSRKPSARPDGNPSAGPGVGPSEGPGAGPGVGPGVGPGGWPSVGPGGGPGEGPGGGPGVGPGGGPGEGPGMGPGARPNKGNKMTGQWKPKSVNKTHQGSDMERVFLSYASHGAVSQVFRLVRQGISPDCCNGQAFILAAQMGHVGVIEALVKLGGDLGAVQSQVEAVINPKAAKRLQKLIWKLQAEGKLK